MGTYFLAHDRLRHRTFNFLAVPFLLLFVAGYYWAGFTTLYQEYQGKMAFERARRIARMAASVE